MRPQISISNYQSNIHKTPMLYLCIRSTAKAKTSLNTLSSSRHLHRPFHTLFALLHLPQPLLLLPLHPLSPKLPHPLFLPPSLSSLTLLLFRVVSWGWCHLHPTLLPNQSPLIFPLPLPFSFYSFPLIHLFFFFFFLHSLIPFLTYSRLEILKILDLESLMHALMCSRGG